MQHFITWETVIVLQFIKTIYYVVKMSQDEEDRSPEEEKRTYRRVRICLRPEVHRWRRSATSEEAEHRQETHHIRKPEQVSRKNKPIKVLFYSSSQ